MVALHLTLLIILIVKNPIRSRPLCIPQPNVIIVIQILHLAALLRLIQIPVALAPRLPPTTVTKKDLARHIVTYYGLLIYFF